MWPVWVSNPGLVTYESGALPTALRGPAHVAEASYLEGGPLLWILPLYLHANQKSNDDDEEEKKI